MTIVDSIPSTYRASGVIAKGSNTSMSSSTEVKPITAFKPSGLIDGNALAVCMYCWSGTTSSGDWIPYRREWV